MKLFPSCILSAVLLSLVHGAHADAFDDRAVMWRANAPLCAAGASWHAFPTKQRDPKSIQPCNDGDMTLFLGLLCAAGEPLGCTGVQEAFEAATGRWARSPRIRSLGHNDEGEAFFSPDMALGVELYVVTTKDVGRASKWLQWIDEHVACPFTLLGWCPDAWKIPRVCTEVPGCFLSHGGMSVMAQTVSWLQSNAGLAALPDHPLRGRLGTFSGYAPTILSIDAKVNEEGFSEHLVGVAIMLLRIQGIHDANIDDAAHTLAKRNPKNAFFAYLAEGKTQHVMDLTLERCPSAPSDGTSLKDEWQWERADTSDATRRTCYWECVFMHRLLRG